MTLQTIVVSVDGSTLALRAVGAAATVAASAQAKVPRLSVAHNESGLAWAYDQAHAAAEWLPSEMSSAIDVVVDGDPVGRAARLRRRAGHRAVFRPAPPAVDDLGAAWENWLPRRPTGVAPVPGRRRQRGQTGDRRRRRRGP